MNLVKGSSLRVLHSMFVLLMIVGLALGASVPQLLTTSNVRSWMDETHIKTQKVEGQVWGPLASLMIQQKVIAHSNLRGPEYSEAIYKGVLGGLFSPELYSPGDRDRKGEIYSSIHQSKEGLLFISFQSFSINGCPLDGSALDLNYHLDCVLETTTNGWVSLPLSIGSLPVKSIEIDLSVI